MRLLTLCLGALALLAAATGSAATHSLSFTFGWYFDPTWSPDGKSIAFVDNGNSDGAGTWGGDLFVMNADGTNVRKLTHTTGDDPHTARTPSWSPDGKRIVFAYSGEGIFVINADGTGLHEIVNGGSDPDWSPGGHKIAFALGNEPALKKIYVVDPRGSHRTLVAAETGDVACSLVSPTWSPDGQRIAFADQGPECLHQIGMVAQYGGRIHALARGQVGADPDWSRGGRKIVYAAFNWHGDRVIRVLDLRTGHRTPLRPGSHPRWSPNSRRIVFSDAGSISVMSADGTELSKLFPR
jgi:TolB protein